MRLEISRRSSEKYTNIKFHENPSSGSRVVPCGRKDGRTDTTEVFFAFRNFANAPKISSLGPPNALTFFDIFLRIMSDYFFIWHCFYRCVMCLLSGTNFHRL